MCAGFALRRPEQALLIALFGSIVLHLLLLMIRVPATDTRLTEPGLLIELSPLPMIRPSQPRPSQPSATKPPPERSEPIEEQPDRSIQANDEPELKTRPEARRPGAQPTRAGAQSATLLSARLLSDVRAQLGRPRIPAASDPLDERRLPELPDAPGWINDYVGTVTPGIERWHNPDGSVQQRIVTADGRVFCGKTSPMTPADQSNPQFALNVMRFRDCGGQRPTPIDRSNPWRRGGPEQEPRAR